MTMGGRLLYPPPVTEEFPPFQKHLQGPASPCLAEAEPGPPPVGGTGAPDALGRLWRWSAHLFLNLPP